MYLCFQALHRSRRAGITYAICSSGKTSGEPSAKEGAPHKINEAAATPIQCFALAVIPGLSFKRLPINPIPPFCLMKRQYKSAELSNEAIFHLSASVLQSHLDCFSPIDDRFYYLF
jgi:hypothetical protein